ncbi:MAG: hypothetical protein K5786_12455 [Treponema sp.]|nr:hypothetical protein [Treponema sp.]
MEQKSLSGIERTLVVQYLTDGNVPVTLTPVEETLNSDEVIHSLTSQIFPVAIKGEQVQVSHKGEIVLENPPQAIRRFANKNVRVEFYFNRVGLYFISKVFENDENENLSLSIPPVIERIIDTTEEKNYDFIALIYFDCKTKKELNIHCVPHEEIELFERPAWKIIPLENQKAAKNLLETFVEEAKVEKNAGNGIQLIPVCKYLTEPKSEHLEAMQDRPEEPSILYVDHERLLLGMTSKACTFFKNEEYGIKLIFSIKKGPILTRDIFVTGIVNKIYRSSDGKLSCVDFKYTTMQEEDLRFLYEKTTSTLFI